MSPDATVLVARCGVRAAFDTVLLTATAFSVDVLTRPTRRPRSDLARAGWSGGAAFFLRPAFGT
eukprot:5641036-Prymnesium_polylepis.1